MDSLHFISPHSSSDTIAASLMTFESLVWGTDKRILLSHGATQYDLRIHILVPLILVTDITWLWTVSALVLVLIPISV